MSNTYPLSHENLPTPNRDIDREVVAGHAAAMLDHLMPGWQDSPHMKDTPARYAKWWDQFLNEEPGNLGTVFPVDSVDQMVVVSGIETWSLCAHHLLPFSASVSIGYLANEKVLGLSKFARIAHYAARRPTSQEQLVADVTDMVQEIAGTEHVAVRASGTHLCMTMRGVKTPATMTTSVTRGAFRTEQATREEWLTLVGQVRP